KRSTTTPVFSPPRAARPKRATGRRAFSRRSRRCRHTCDAASGRGSEKPTRCSSACHAQPLSDTSALTGLACPLLPSAPYPYRLEEDRMADDRDRQNPEESDEIGRAADEDVNAATNEDDEFEDTDEELEDDEDADEEGK